MSDVALTDLLHVDAADRMRRLAFLRIDDETRSHLRQLGPLVREIADTVVARFYAHLFSFAETALFLGDPSLVARLREAQKGHLIALVEGEHDIAYFESRLRVGMIHARIGLEPQWYIGAFMAQIEELNGAVLAKYANDLVAATNYVNALAKAALLDIELTIDAYIHSGFIERSLAEAHRHEATRARAALSARDEEEARKEELLRMVVHDVRSPVAAMISSARLGMRRHPDVSGSPGKQFRLIEESGVHVLEIIDNILTIARVTRGSMPLRCEDFDAAELVRACAEELAAFAATSQHILSYDSPGAVPVRALDRSLVRRIVSNLITNAVRHTPSATGIRVSCSRVGSSVVTVVDDDGPGISPSIVAALLDGDSSAQRRSEGAYLDSGLGLPFCRLATERMGGQLRIVRSDRGGACIVVELPADGASGGE